MDVTQLPHLWTRRDSVQRGQENLSANYNNNIMGFLRNAVLVLGLSILVALYAPGIPPHDVDLRVIDMPRTKFDGVLKPNRKLDAFVKLPEEVEGATFNHTKGPEAFAVKGRYLYTGILGGDIIRHDLRNPGLPWQKVFKYGQPCRAQFQEQTCGRPLGMRFDSAGQLVVADSVYGIYRVNVESGTGEMLVPSDLIIDGQKNLVTNSVAPAKDGTIYYTVSSTKHYLYQGLLELLTLSDPSGRVVKYDPKTKKSTVLMDKIGFANGIALDDREEFLIFSDMGRAKITRIYLKGPKAGQSDTFAQPPGLVDNISNTGGNRFFAGIVMPLPTDDKFNFFVDGVLKYPLLNRYLLRLVYNSQMLLNWVKETVFGGSSDTLDEMIYWLTHFETCSRQHYGLVVEYDKDGKLVNSWHSPDGKIVGISEATLVGHQLYLGSPWNTFAAKLKI